MRSKLLGVMFVVLYLFFIPGFRLSNSPKTLEIKVFSVGQGDSIFIRTPNGKVILIDGGPDYGVSRLVSNETGVFNCHIDLIVLTHPHSDHVVGLNRLLEMCTAETILYNNTVYDSGVYRKWQNLVSERNAIRAVSGDLFVIDGLSLYVLWPPEVMTFSENVNNGSIVLLADYGEIEFLLTGDAEALVQEQLDYELMESKIEGRLEVLKVPHQGSKDSLNKKLIQALEPVNSVISVGENNSYGHPHKSVVDYLERNGSEVYRTDNMGTVQFSYPVD